MELLARYIDAKSKLDRYKRLEAELRIQLTDTLFPNAIEGTQNAFIDNIKIKAKFGINYNLDKIRYNEIQTQLSDDELACIEIKPSLSPSKYKALKASGSSHSLLDECITASPAMPSVEIINEDII